MFVLKYMYTLTAGGGHYLFFTMAGKWWEMGDLLWEIGQNLVDFFWHFFTRGQQTFMIEF